MVRPSLRSRPKSSSASFRLGSGALATLAACLFLQLVGCTTGRGVSRDVSSARAGEEIVFDLPGGAPLVMVKIPQGSFLMGSPQNEVDAGWVGNELPQHEVTIAHDFWMGKYEVTQRQWLAVTGSNPSSYSPANPRGRSDVTLDNPVETVTWEAIQDFEERLNELGLGGTFRLPSEAEWEHAARGGTRTRFSFGDSTCSPRGYGDCDLSRYAWWEGNQKGYAAHHPVGQRLPNPFGLYDTAGNVWEWCEDWHHDYTGAPTDGSAWVSPVSSYRVLRGGAWTYPADSCRPAARSCATPRDYYDTVGFRLVWTP